METYKNLKKGTKVGLILSFVFVIIGVILSTISLLFLIGNDAFSIPLVLGNAANFVLYAFVAFYTFAGYKKSHGNMLRYLYLTFGAYIVVEATLFPSFSIAGLILGNICYTFAALIITYVAGRLQKIEKNRWLLVVAGILMLVRLILVKINLPIFAIGTLLGDITPLLIHLAIGFAYTARYEEHKAAGLEDAN